MKKILAWLLVMMMMLSMCACGAQENTNTDVSDETTDVQSDSESESDVEEAKPEEPVAVELSLTDTNIVEGMVEYSMVTMYSSNDVMPPKQSSFYTHYTPVDGNTYIVAMLDVKNLGNADVSADQLLATELVTGGESYAGKCVVELEDGTELSDGAFESVAALSTARLYYLFSVPADADVENLELSVTAGDDTRTVMTGLSAFESKVKNIELNAEITDEETLSMTVNDIYFDTTLYPPAATGYYSYYEAEVGKTYLIIKATVKNLKGSDMIYDNIAGVKCIYNDKYNYSTFAVAEEDGGADLNGYPSQCSIAPLDSGVVYYIAEVPEEVESGKVDVSMYIAGEYYNYTVQ